ncbi:hypothetical protein SGPA1_21766 [Streptomyces misionensis JCM 4497]
MPEIGGALLWVRAEAILRVLLGKAGKAACGAAAQSPG